MKRYLAPLLALALVAGACSSNVASSFKVKQPVAAVPAGTVKTAWGELPSYTANSDAFPFELNNSRRRGPTGDVQGGGTTVLDVLVKSDGYVGDVSVLTSSGNADVDRFAVNSFVGARSLLRVDATAPTPYVVRQTFKLDISGSSLAGTGLGTNSRNEENRYSDMRPMGTGQRLAGDKN